jgi:hypothetical protein
MIKKYFTEYKNTHFTSFSYNLMNLLHMRVIICGKAAPVAAWFSYFLFEGEGKVVPMLN